MPDKKNNRERRPLVPLAPQAAASAKQKFGGLGKGLDALISRGASARGGEPRAAAEGEGAQEQDAAPAQSAGADAHGAVLTVLRERIQPGPWQPRHDFNEDALKDLADSIKAHGIIQPLVCRAAADGSYELIGGERRLRAAAVAGLAEVPIMVIGAADRDAAEIALVENIQREDLNALEEAEAYRALSEGFGLTQEEIAERVGKARASVANSMRLLDLPDEVKQMLSAGALSTGHAKVILGVDGDAERVRLASEAVKTGLTVRMLERKAAKGKSAPEKNPAPDIPPEYHAELLDRLTRRFGTGVRLTPSMRHANGKRARGRLEIDFMDNEDLGRLLALVGVDVNEWE